MYDADVFVLGGGPAGLAAAIAARRAGLRVILADAARPPIDKACGEGLMPDSLAAARQLGIVLQPGCGRALRGIRFQGAGHAISADFPNGSGLSVRRTVLQPLLAERAKQVGVDLQWGCPVTSIHGNTVSTARGAIETRWIVGADGAQSSVRRWAGLESFSRNAQRFSYRKHYRAEPWSDYVEVFWGDDCQFYVSPTSANELCVALLTRDPRRRIERALPQVPELARRLADREPTSAERGRFSVSRRLRSVTQGNVALIGDASGTIDPITGEGMCLAFKQAITLAGALADGKLQGYETAHRRLTRRPRLMADFMLLMDRSSFLRKRTLAAFERHPDLFSSLLAVHVGAASPLRFATTATALGLQLIAS